MLCRSWANILRHFCYFRLMEKLESRASIRYFGLSPDLRPRSTVSLVICVIIRVCCFWRYSGMYTLAISMIDAENCHQIPLLKRRENNTALIQDTRFLYSYTEYIFMAKRKS